MNWKDTTSYSRNDRERRPNAFTARAGDLRITVVRDHIYFPGRWVLHSEPFYNTYELRGIAEDDVAGAQAKALELVRAKLAAVNAALD